MSGSRTDADDGASSDGAPSDGVPGDGAELGEQRAAMVEEDLRERGIGDPRVLAAMAAVPREQFVPAHLTHAAYADRPLPIESGQTISQPYMVALMVESARITPEDRVLEVGTGSGYAAAVLDELAAEVWTVERHAALAEAAREALERSGHSGVHVRWSDGALGWAEAAPFDVIVVAAASPEVPAELVEQLAEGGRLVVPVGRPDGPQELVLVRRSDGATAPERLGPVQFVPLVPGRAGGGVAGPPEVRTFAHGGTP